MSVLYIDNALKQIGKMPENTIDEIIDKYIKVNIAHPFKEGNGRAIRIGLDQILRGDLSMCIDWSQINKNDYLRFMELSPVEGKYITNLLANGLTEEIDNRETYMKGIDCSYEYESENSISIFDIEEEIGNY